MEEGAPWLCGGHLCEFTSAEVKAESDICCTSSNALNVVRSLPPDQPILFVPDRNLGSWINKETGRVWSCGPILPHSRSAYRTGSERTAAALSGSGCVVHPEVPPEVTELADAIRSTAGILKYVQESPPGSLSSAPRKGFSIPCRSIAGQGIPSGSHRVFM